MAQLDDLWLQYGLRQRPGNCGDSVDSVRLGELDDEIQDVVGIHLGANPAVAPSQVARLGLALADLTRVLPKIEPGATHEYFVMVESLARAALTAVMLKEKHEC